MHMRAVTLSISLIQLALFPWTIAAKIHLHLHFLHRPNAHPCAPPTETVDPPKPPDNNVGRQIKEEAAKGAVEEMLKAESPGAVLKGGVKSGFWAGVEALDVDASHVVPAELP